MNPSQEEEEAEHGGADDADVVVPAAGDGALVEGHRDPVPAGHQILGKN